MISFAHLPAAVLTEATAQATAAVPRLSQGQRHKAARRLAHAVRNGQVPPAALRAVLSEDAPTASDDHRFVRAAEAAMASWRRRLAPLPRLPASMSAPFDPSWTQPARRAAAVQWTSALVREGILDPTEVDACFTSMDSARGTFRDAFKRSLHAEIARITAAIGLTDGSRKAEPLWALLPTYLTELDVSECKGAVLYPGTVNDQFAYTFPLTIEHYGFDKVSRAIGTLRLRTFSLVAPHELCSEGFTGSMFYADLEAYAEQAIDAEGNVVIDDDLCEHLMNEYGMDVVNDQDTRTRVERMYRFLQMQKSHFSGIGTLSKEVASLRAAAAHAPTAGIGEALGRIAALLKLAPKTTASSPDVTSEPLNEEGYCSGALVMAADLAGSEEHVLEEIDDLNMQTGCANESLLDCSDPGHLASVALREIAFTTVLATVLNHLAGAFHVVTDPQARPAAA